jgi:hypothetical protein
MDPAPVASSIRASSTNQHRQNAIGRISLAMGIDGKPKPRSGIGEALMNEGMLGKSRPSSIRSNRSQYQISEPLSSPYRTPPPPHRRYRTISTVRARYLGEHYPSPIITSTTPHFTSSPCMRPYDLRSSTPDICSRPSKCIVFCVHPSASRTSSPRGRPRQTCADHMHARTPFHAISYEPIHSINASCY